MTETANLGLPCIDAAQAQKHVTHNEALRILDTLVQLAVLDRDLTSPPGSPGEGQRWIVKNASPSGAWAGHGNQIAAWQDGGWQFSSPKVGWLAYVVDEGVLLAWSGSAWIDALSMLTTLQNIALLGFGTIADATNPFSAKLNNALWVAETVAEGGDGHLRYKMSKESAAKTLSLLLQTNFSGRAEVGLTGDDDLHFKVSPDGTAWLEALLLDHTTGKLALGQGFSMPATTRGQLGAAPFDALAYNGLQTNGGMSVSQESGANSVVLAASGAVQTKYLVDGVMATYRGTFVAAGQQVSDAPGGYSNSLKFTVSTAEASLGANDELTVVIPIEGYRAARLAFGTVAASPVSLAFWVKAHRPGTYSGAIKNTNVGGGSPHSYPFTFAINSADTWEFKTVTVSSGDGSGTWGTTTSAGLYVAIAIAAGSSRVGGVGGWSASDYSGATGTTNGVAATSDTFQLTGLIVLPGIELPSLDRAPFIMRPFPETLELCQRYYWKSFPYATAPAQNAGSSGQLSWPAVQNGANASRMPTLKFPLGMRVAPTMTLYNPANTNAQVRDLAGMGADCSASSASDITAESFRIVCTGNASTVVGNLHAVHVSADARMS